MRQSGIINTLRDSFLFKQLPKEDLEKIALLVVPKDYKAGETIVWQGKPSNSLFLIVNGIVVVKKLGPEGREHILAYLLPGLSFGEVGILENEPRSATVSALSEVQVLEIRREDFLVMLHHYPSVAVELARLLGRYLVETSKRQSLGDRKARLILLMNVAGKSGGTSICSFLAQEMAEQTGQSTVFMEYPNPETVVHDFGIAPETKVYSHPGGFDVLVSPQHTFVPADAAATLMLDSIFREYQNIIISTQGDIDDNVKIMLEYARQILIVTPPDSDSWQQVEVLRNRLKTLVKANTTFIFTVLNHNHPDPDWDEANLKTDAEIPYIPDFPKLISKNANKLETPPTIKKMLDSFIDRLERNNRIAIYIPTTIDVDQPIDTTAYANRTSEFLALKFGGATYEKEAQGVWNSESLGPVGEKVHIVHTYATLSDMNAHLDEVIEFVKSLKEELRQEAMALEVNHKLTLL